MSLRQFLANSAHSLTSEVLRFADSSFGARISFVYRKSGAAVGVATTHIGDISE